MAPRLIDSFATTPALSALFSDDAVLSAMFRFEVALARTQGQLGIIPATTAEALTKAGAPEAAALAGEARQSASIAVPFIRALTERVSRENAEAGGFVHFGATSQDLVDTAMILLLREARQVLAAEHAGFAAAMRDLSERHAGAVMLGRTLLQPAPPITFGYKAALWRGEVQRSWRELARAFDLGLQLQFGGASGTLAAYGNRGMELAAALARELEIPLPAAPWHSQRGSLAAIVAHCGIYGGALAKIARDIALLMQPEIGELEERGGGSSAMPNKKNPAASVVALASAGRVPGLVAAFLAAMPQEHERAAGGWQSEWPVVTGVIEATGSTLAAVADAVRGITVNVQRMRANIDATHGSVFAEKAAMLLAPKLGRTAAQAAVREALSRNALSEILTADQWKTLARPEDYLGAAEQFRLALLEDAE